MSVSRSGDNLVVWLNGSTDQVTVQNYFLQDGRSQQGYTLDAIRFDDGTSWDYGQVKALLQQGATPPAARTAFGQMMAQAMAPEALAAALPPAEPNKFEPLAANATALEKAMAGHPITEPFRPGSALWHEIAETVGMSSVQAQRMRAQREREAAQQLQAAPLVSAASSGPQTEMQIAVERMVRAMQEFCPSSDSGAFSHTPLQDPQRGSLQPPVIAVGPY
ncbi:calcium-binding protein [Hydrogenophaga sp. BPS33]|uniref:calcium-binding protein n=1 Tax=Hydrogenophaga sp. BPS33 TaxID=2651974 RepID=UPI001359377B|nr:calcium-binding protein [Hydrogenophaga sp. BPS33]